MQCLFHEGGDTMAVLVTGGGGFLGRHIVKRLQDRGAEVRVLGRRPYPDLSEQGVNCIQGDLTDEAIVKTACDGVDAVFHVAALAGVWGKRESYYQPNVIGTKNVLAACKACGVPKLVYTSTPSVVYGHDPIENGDEALPYPETYLTHYADTKSIAERSVLAASGTDGFAACSLRPHLIWGPGDTNLIPRIRARAQAGRLMQVGDGSNRISISYVENIADAHIHAYERLEAGSPLCGQAYFVNETEPVNCWGFIGDMLKALDCPPIRKKVSFRLAYAMGAIFETVYKLLGKQEEPLMTRFLALQLATSHWFNTAKAQRDLEWSPVVPVEEGLQRIGSAAE